MSAQDNYLQSAVHSASTIGLMILLYDRLVTDLRLAVEAMKNSDIEKRCEHMNHAFLVLEALGSYLDMEQGGETAASLNRFYGVVRSHCIVAQVQNAPDMLEKQIEAILEVRQAWQQVENKSASKPAQPQVAAQAPYGNSGPAAMLENPSEDAPASSWTA